MKKTRNSFFAESNFQAYNPNMMNQNIPFSESSNYSYFGPVPNNNYNTNMGQSDIESRLAKIERQINRMDYRISKLENNGTTITTEDYENNTTNMYML